MSTPEEPIQPNPTRNPNTRVSNEDSGKLCDGCNPDVVWVSHPVRHRGVFRRFCTSCVLRLNAGRFCPACYTVFHEIPVDFIRCVKCDCKAHLQCVGEKGACYVCPPCSDPRFVYFGPEAAEKGIDLNLARQLRAAAQIADENISKVADACKAELWRLVAKSAAAREEANRAMKHLRNLQDMEMQMNEGTVVLDPVATAPPVPVAVWDKEMNERTVVPDPVATVPPVPPVPVAVWDKQINAEGKRGVLITGKRKKVVEVNPENSHTPQGVDIPQLIRGASMNGKRNYYVESDKGKVCMATSSKLPFV